MYVVRYIKAQLSLHTNKLVPHIDQVLQQLVLHVYVSSVCHPGVFPRWHVLVSHRIVGGVNRYYTSLRVAEYSWGSVHNVRGGSVWNRLGFLNMLNATCGKIHGWGPHPWNMPSHLWTGGGLHESRATDSAPKSALYVWLSFVCHLKIHIIFVLDFSYSLSFLLCFLPTSMDPIYPTCGFFILR